MSEAYRKLGEARSEAVKLITSGRPFLLTLTPLPIEGETEAPSPISCVAAPTTHLDIVVHALALHFHLALDLVSRSVKLVANDVPGGEAELMDRINAVLDYFAQTELDIDAHARVIPPPTN